MNSQHPQTVLSHYFGYSDFRAGQLPIIQSILEKRNTVAFLPTGGGKSLCFQIPGLILPGLTIVISPLISLMKDQVDTLNSKNIFSTYLNSSLSREELKSRLELMRLGKFQFVYVAPERLTVRSFLTICQRLPISLVVIDEAHCISQWGHDFRPSYLKINSFLQALPIKPVIAAFTATATELVKTDIIQQLQLADAQLFANSFRRTNLHFSVLKCQSDFEQQLLLLKLVIKFKNQSGIIYANSIEKVETLSQLLTHFGIPCRAYHAKLDKSVRAKLQDDFVHNKIQLMAATNAFGMGVDKSNVRFVIHYQLPSNLENYYQEAGRAGRDGMSANCYLLYNPADIKILVGFLDKSHPDNHDHFRKLNLLKLNQIIQYCLTPDCRTQYILRYFNESATKKCLNCDNCQPNLVLQKSNLSYRKILQLNKVLQKKSHSKSYPFTFKISCYCAILKPQSKAEYRQIPGIGRGWLEKWYNTVSSYDHLWRGDQDESYPTHQ